MSNEALSKYMKSFWRGYRAAKALTYDCGHSAVVSEYQYGLSGCGTAYCRGWVKYMIDHKPKAI